MDFAELRGARGPMSLVGAGLLWLERPDAPLTVAALATLSGGLRRDELVRELEGRLHRLPRLMQRPLPFRFDLAYPSWEDAPQFRAADHVCHWGLPGDGGEAALRELTAQLIAQPLRTDRPLWEMHLIEGLTGERSALLLKVHHCLLEGVAGTRMLELLLGRASERARPVHAPVPEPASGAVARLTRAWGERQRRRARWLRSALSASTFPALRDGLRATRDAARKLGAHEVPRLTWNAPLGPRRRVSFLSFPLAELDRIRSLHGATLNDALLALLAGGLQRFLTKRGEASDVLEVMVLIPVSLPGAGSELGGGRFSALRVRLPVRASDDRARLRATRAVLDRLKAQRAWSGVSGLLSAAELLPPPLLSALLRHISIGRVANLIASNVPGPSESRYLCGQRIESVHPLMPIVDNVGLSLAAYSYAGVLHLGLNADADLVPDLDGLADAMHECLEQLVR